MSTSFSANQYDSAFISKKLSNWECPDEYCERPRQMSGFTQIIANNRGHLTAGVSRSRNNPWGNFVGTWDLPRQIPGNCAKVSTARTTYAQEKLHNDAESANHVLSGSQKNCNRHLMRESTFSKTKPLASLNRPGSGPRSGAAAPASKMYNGTSPLPYITPVNNYYTKRTPTPRRMYTPARDDAYGYPPRVDTVRSPIPHVPDIPEVLAQEARPCAFSPPSNKAVDGLFAL